ncbi:MAG: hypothetical protein LQ352_005241 [Teloschistes flavicans]|nr:MAG: hypothetical protein LQ352_005241 [Teloschistes flavicans]
MAQSPAAEIGNAILNASHWCPVWTLNTTDRVPGDFSQAVPPSGSLYYFNFTGNSTIDTINYGFLRYNYTSTDPVSQVPNALDYYFRQDIFSYRAFCTYPISGQYGFLNRFLFYILMIFALVVRKHRWLAAAALGTSMTYSASAAAHAFALL